MIPTTFINYASEVIVETSDDLIRSKIAEYCSVYAVDYGMDISRSEFPLVDLFLLFTSISIGQNLEDLDSYTVDEFYKKIGFDGGTIDEDGDEDGIDYIYVKT